jgi:hypothetical protein
LGLRSSLSALRTSPIVHSPAGAGLGQTLVYIGQYRHPVLFLSLGAGFLEMHFLPFLRREQSLRSPLKPSINPTFKAIVVQVRILGLKMAKMPFSAGISPWKWHFYFLQRFLTISTPAPVLLLTLLRVKVELFDLKLFSSAAPEISLFLLGKT